MSRACCTPILCDHLSLSLFHQKAIETHTHTHTHAYNAVVCLFLLEFVNRTKYCKKSSRRRARSAHGMAAALAEAKAEAETGLEGGVGSGQRSANAWQRDTPILRRARHITQTCGRSCRCCGQAGLEEREKESVCVCVWWECHRQLPC